jgi:hypothetical protein
MPQLGADEAIFEFILVSSATFYLGWLALKAYMTPTAPWMNFQ